METKEGFLVQVS